MTGKNRKHSAARLLVRVLMVIAGLVFGLNIYRWNAAALAGNTLPMPFGTGVAVVLSGSMEPALKVDDLIIVREAENYEVGDIVVYQSGHTLIVHRVIAKDGETVVTQGDANNIADDPIQINTIKGKVVARVPAVGALINALKSPAGSLIVLLAAFALTELSFRREKSEDDKKLEAIKEEIRRLREEQDEKE